MFCVEKTSDGWPCIYSDKGYMQRDPCSWLNDCIGLEYAKSTANDNARMLCDWMNFQWREITRGTSKYDLYFISTDMLKKYRDSKKDSRLCNTSTINRYIRVVCKFLWWAKEHGRCSASVIGWNDMLSGKHHRVVVHKAKNSECSIYRIPFLLEEHKSVKKKVPTIEQVDKLKNLIRQDRKASRNEWSNEELYQRDMLIIRWMSEAGLRREEVVSLRLSDIAIFKDQNPFGTVEVLVQHGTKGSKPRYVEVSARLVRDTNAFVEFDRPVIMSSFHEKSVDTQEIFISSSHRGGIGMKAHSITNLLDIGDSEISPHGLRRYAITNYAKIWFRLEKKLVDCGERSSIDEEAIKFRLQQFAGHNSFDTTLKHYLDIAKATALTSDGEKILGEYQNFLELELDVIKTIRARAELDHV